MKPRNQGRWGFQGACGVCTSLLLMACGPRAVVDAESSETPSSQQQPTGNTTALPSPTGRSWYVGPKGSDGGKGTLEAPLRSIGKAAALAGPGDIIRVLPGTYSEELSLESRGKDAAAITLHGEGVPRPTLVPAAQAQSEVIRVRGRWSLDNLHIDVGGARMFAVAFEPGSDGSALANSELNGGSSSAGVLVEGTQGLLIQNNSIHHFIKPGDDSHGVVVVGPSRDVTVQGNDIHHNSGDSIQCQAGSGPAQSLSIQGNTLHDSGENAVDIKQCVDVVVSDNEMEGFPNPDVRAVGSSAGEAVVLHLGAQRVTVQNNVISNAGRGISVLGDGADPVDIRLVNNHLSQLHNVLTGNGQGIRIQCARGATVTGNTIEDAESYGLMLAADGKTITGLQVSNNLVRGASKALLVRLGQEQYRPGMSMTNNQYSANGILKADGVAAKLGGSAYLADFPGEQLTLSSANMLSVWQQVLGVDQGTGLLQ